MIEKSGPNISRGIYVPALDRTKKWEFEAKAAVGDEVEAGDIIGIVQETPVVEHRIMVPHRVKGTVKSIQAGSFTVEEVVCVVAGADGK